MQNPRAFRLKEAGTTKTIDIGTHAHIDDASNEALRRLGDDYIFVFPRFRSLSGTGSEYWLEECSWQIPRLTAEERVSPMKRPYYTTKEYRDWRRELKERLPSRARTLLKYADRACCRFSDETMDRSI